jgi:protein-L-isoaspartate O-methyltransferase
MISGCFFEGSSGWGVDAELIRSRMFIPVDDDKYGYGQHIFVVDKDENGKVTKTKQYGVSYVPLTDAPK